MRGAVLVLLVGCGGISFGDYGAELVDANCAYLVRCEAFATTADCRAYYARNAIDNPNVAAAIEAGKIAYDEDAAARCLDAIASLSCTSALQTEEELAACAQVLTGRGASGATCAFDRECESDNCQVPACTMACCTGTCGPPQQSPGIGEPCTVLCDGDAYCGADSLCHAPLPAGAVCDNLTVCAAGFYCAGLTTSDSGVCSAVPKRGEACDDVCAEIGSTCIGGICVAAGLPGDSCSVATQCSPYYTCSDAGQCSAYPTRGTPCTGRCSDDSFCLDGTCAEQKQNGEPCTYNDECRTHFCRDSQCGDVPLCI